MAKPPTRRGAGGRVFSFVYVTEAGYGPCVALTRSQAGCFGSAGISTAPDVGDSDRGTRIDDSHRRRRLLRSLATMGYTHEYLLGYSAPDPTEVTPGVHLVASLLKRWLTSTRPADRGGQRKRNSLLCAPRRGTTEDAIRRSHPSHQATSPWPNEPSRP